jgi:uroporphyrinogen decarboxylase
MTHRERWIRHMHFEPVDYIPDEEFGYWESTFPRWHQEGLPKEIADNGIADQFFGFSPRAGVGMDLGLRPGFDTEILEHGDRYVLLRDGAGVLCKVFTDGHETIPQYLDFPLKTRRDWEDLFLPRLDPNDPERVAAADELARQGEALAHSEAPVVVFGGSLFGTPRGWAGFEGISYMIYDDPGLFEEIVEHMCVLACTLLKKILVHVKTIDAGAFWEDMAYKAGCIISPKTFRQYLTPRYKRITDLLAEAGCDISFVDCDGNIMDVAECWIEGGVNCMFPVEVAGGSDPLALREKLGRKCLLLGGVNKRALALGRDAIDEELERLRPHVMEGGWIPHVDHRVPPDVPYADYLYYLESKRRIFGIPTPEPWEVRKALAAGLPPPTAGVEHFDEREKEDKRIAEFLESQEGDA